MLGAVISHVVVNCSGIQKRCSWSCCNRLSSILHNKQPEWFLLAIYVYDVRDIFIVIQFACNTCQLSDRYAKQQIHGKTFAGCHLSHSMVFNRKHDYGFTYGYNP